MQGGWVTSAQRPAESDSSPRDPAAGALREAVRAVESRGSTTSDLPPLSAEAHEAAKAGLRLLRARARSAHELRERLVARELPGPAVDEAMERFEAWGLLNDAEFAHEWVRGRRRRRGKATGALRRELQAKGVSPHYIESALGHSEPEDERARASELVRARLERTGTVPEGGEPEAEKAVRRLVAFLERRGFPQGMALAVVRQEIDAARS